MSNYRSFYPSGYRPGGGYRVGAYGVGGLAQRLPQVNPPYVWYSSDNVDGLNNASMVADQQVATWVNLGTAASANATQATAGSRPLWRAVATAGLMGNKPAVQSDGVDDRLVTGTLTSQAQPLLIACVFRMTALAVVGVHDSQAAAADRHMLAVNGTGGVILNGGTQVTTASTIANTTWETSVAVFNGASSFVRINGAQSANVSIGTNNFSGVTLFCDGVPATDFAACFIREYIAWVGPNLPDPAAVEADLYANNGVTPQ